MSVTIVCHCVRLCVCSRCLCDVCVPVVCFKCESGVFVCVVGVSEWAFVCTCKREWLCVYTRAYVTPCLGPWTWECVALCAWVYLIAFLYVQARAFIFLYFCIFLCALACLSARLCTCVWVLAVCVCALMCLILVFKLVSAHFISQYSKMGKFSLSLQFLA